MDVVFGLDGALYYADFDGGTIRRIAATDTTSPTVSVTQPGAGSTVSGTVTLGANASDNVAIAGVQFRVDGVNVGAEGTTEPLPGLVEQCDGLPSGPHAITAVASRQGPGP